MLIPIVFPSAGSIWLNFDLRGTGNRPLMQTDLPIRYNLFPDKEAIRNLLMKYALQEPLSVLSPHADARRSNKLFSCITRAKYYPSNAFYELERIAAESDTACRVLLACPELCFLQAAAQLSF